MVDSTEAVVRSQVQLPKKVEHEAVLAVLEAEDCQVAARYW